MPLYRGLLVSCGRNAERSASSEIHYVFTEHCGLTDDHFSIHDTRISGLITVSLNPNVNSHEIIRVMQKLDKEKPFFMHVLKIRPIDFLVEADIEKIVESIQHRNINREGSFRISVYKRHNPLKSMDIIKAVAALFPNTVSLENPDWKILIEIVADKLGYAIIEPELLFSTQLAFEQESEDVPNWFLD